MWAGSNFLGINTFGGIVGGRFSFHFGEAAIFSLSVMGEFLWDQWDETRVTTPTIDPPATQGEQVAARLKIGALFQYWIVEYFSILAVFDIKAAGDDRKIYNKAFWGVVDKDTAIYGRLGVCFKF